MKKIAVITSGTSDLLDAIKLQKLAVDVIEPRSIPAVDFEQYDAIAMLGGTDNKPMLLKAAERIIIEAQLQKGKKVFAEYVASIGHVYCAQPESTQFRRLVFCSEDVQIEGLELGMLLEDQSGMRIKPHDIACSHNVPILQYTTVHAHDRIELPSDFHKHISDRALWFENQGQLLVCSFRLSSFIRARFAPRARIEKIVAFIMEWLTGQPCDLEQLPQSYTTGSLRADWTIDQHAMYAAQLAMGWFERANIVRNNGLEGAIEGLGSEIYCDGSQKINSVQRADCIGEISFAYYMEHLVHGRSSSLELSNQLYQYMIDHFVCKEWGPFRGMMRWTEEAWGVCYQDDVARAIIPQLLKQLYEDKDDELPQIFQILEFLVQTTGVDGTRIMRTDNKDLTNAAIAQLSMEPGNLPSAHYNGYYIAALLLAYKLGGKQSFLDTALRGLDTIMNVYPNTTREQSETQEYCRLILPLSWAYWVTGADRYKDWLYQVTQDLQKFRHSSGAYLEWDSGYTAVMRNEVGEGESSLLAHNGDPVVDLLYSNNWLPVAFMQAYFVTKDDDFLRLWEEHARFIVQAQIHSDNHYIHGAWARAFDVNLKEVYASPADAGWGPWAIESGWTVAEIAAGLMMGLARDQLIEKYR
ncbi:hypothetical protein [Paenibacillus sp. GXUN7292]|uniref:hypothetical protein n=1 Tax=Paenibacillus sp. GXUN7292 TaxID=3422499 RepID=UPI003D7C740C